MVAPCDKYQGLVVGPDGQTVADPYGKLATIVDYEEWRAVASNLIDKVEAELQRMFDKYGAPDEETAGPVLSLRERWNELGSAISQSIQTFPEISWAGSIVSMVELAKDAACQIGVVESRIIELGGIPNDYPTPPARPASGGKGKGTALMLVILGLGYFLGGRER
jgi:hypothetical protein